ncbi:type II toxin-antitoxin system HicB family antitoxin [Desulfovibrio subterraneus]|uniref:type II toxin-antitoxin system HicB family antitoxin n=1 Tax=Desulfovibrio subterraneus TaxID=2718620 RepID=UPI0022B858D7|nr:type II toxin-antitoxin system HicB family antitoxin [Desulfovibrio subterraneus]WBF66050.1 type II toxin-antitoxin system HicB family antitoxin [Desulfovibrio subterraneus]
MAAYYAIITQDEGNPSYGLHFHDLCALTVADTIEELEVKGKEMLKVYLEETEACGLPIPTSSDYRTVAAEAEKTIGMVGVMLVTAAV